MSTRGDELELLRTMVDAVGDVLWLLDASTGRITYVSPAYERVWGRSAAALLADPEELRKDILPEDRPAAEAAFGAILRGEIAVYDVLYRLAEPDGSTRWVNNRAWMMRDGSRRLVGIARDVTAQRASAGGP